MPKGVFQRTAQHVEQLRQQARELTRQREERYATEGRPPRATNRKQRSAGCRNCGTTFRYMKWPGEPLRRACSKSCAHAIAVRAKRKISADYLTMYELYWTKQLSGPEIGKMLGVTSTAIFYHMRRLGIDRRAKGTHPDGPCLVAGCAEPRYRRRKPSGRMEYGRRCRSHHREHTNRLAREYRLRVTRWKRQGIVGDESDALAAVDRAIPHDIPDYVREEIKQELIVRLLLGEITGPEMPEAIKSIRSGLEPDRFRTISLDTPLGDSDGLTFADVIANDRPHF